MNLPTKQADGSGRFYEYVIDNIRQMIADGELQAVKAEIRSDGGAYCFSTKGTVAKSAICGAGPYQIENVKVTATGYYTNNTP